MKDVKFIQFDSRFYYPLGHNLHYSVTITKELSQVLKRVFNNYPIVLWCRGSSGAIISGIMSSFIPIERIMHIKKEGESSHHSGVYLNEISSNCVHVIIDDFCVSGETVNKIYSTMKQYYIEPDCLCLTKDLNLNRLNFIPNVVICSYIYNNNPSINII